jgi:germination protein M
MSPARRRRPRRPGDIALKRIAFAWLAGAALVAALAGCGGGKQRTTTTTPPPTTSFRVYFLRDGRVQPVRRTVPHTTAVAHAALEALAQGPTDREANDLGVATKLRSAPDVTISAGTAHIGAAPGSAAAQIVYTLTQFPAVKRVEIAGKTYTRKDFEDETPLILVESPLPYQKVTSPLHATGTANTFEATFQYELRDPDGKIVAKHFVTATSGTGTRGTFDFTAPFSFHHPGIGALVVYELSAENGSRIHQVEIPVHLTR